MKRVLTVLLLIILCFSCMFSACREDNATQNEVEDPTEITDPDEQTTTNENSLAEYKERMDLKAKECDGALYNITFMVDGEEYVTIKSGETSYLDLPPEPEKEGYFFVAWLFDSNQKPGYVNSLYPGKYVGFTFSYGTDGILISAANTENRIVYAHFLKKRTSTDGKGLTFALTASGDSYSVTDFNNEYTEVIIPETYNGLPVTEIGAESFQNADNLVHVTIPDSCKLVGMYAFDHCISLKEVFVPSSVSEIGVFAYAFLHCYSLKKAVFEGDHTKIQWHTFQYCCSLEYFIIPDTVTEIFEYAFFACRSIKSIIIPKNIKSLGAHSFFNCSSLENLVLPDDLQSLGSGVFTGTSIKTITIPPLIKVIADNAFCECRSLEKIVLPEGLETIYELAFFNCLKLKDINIPDSVRSIADNAFENCESLKEIPGVNTVND